MPNYRLAAQRAAIRNGIDPALFLRQIDAESGFNPNAGSNAGARGIAQFMPETARGAGVSLGDGRASDDLDGAARLMAGYVKKYGNYRDALVAYNAGPGRVGKPLYAETANYVAKVLKGGATPPHAALLGSTSPRAMRPAAPPTTSGGAASADQRAARSAAVASADQRAARGAAVADFLGRRDADPLDFALEVRALNAVSSPSSGTTRPAANPRPASSIPAAPGSGGSSSGLFRVSGPNPGRLKPALVAFADKVARVYGARITGSDGSGHSVRTATGGVSQHSTGNATDIPASGRELLALGRAALIAAGMPRAQAMAQRGGLFNFPGGVQIIFNDTQKISGSSHMDHLHISHG